MENLITYFAHWTLAGVFACVIIPRIEWKTQWKRRLFIFACGPLVWVAVWASKYQIYEDIVRDRLLDGNTQADFDKVNTANADMQIEISELRDRLAKLIRSVRRARKGKIGVGDIEL